MMNLSDKQIIETTKIPLLWRSRDGLLANSLIMRHLPPPPISLKIRQLRVFAKGCMFSPIYCGAVCCVGTDCKSSPTGNEQNKYK